MTSVTHSSSPNSTIPAFDGWLAGLALILLVIGFVMVASSSMEIAQKTYSNPFYFTQRHGFYLLVGLLAAVIAACVPMSFWRAKSGFLLIMSFVLLIAVLIPHVGREVNGSMRWVKFGPLNLQTSEIAKFGVIVYLAGYLVRRRDEVRQRWSGFIKPMVIMAALVVLLLMEPDFGAVVVTMGAVIGVMFLAGMRLMQFSVLIGSCLLAGAFIAIAQPYRMQRLTTFADPWADPLGSGYQLTQALIAFGRGEWLGLGLGNSVQKLFYLPEAHTDFLFAVIAEELGLLGAIAIIFCFVLFILRALEIGKQAEKRGQDFSAYVAYGIAFLFFNQFLINIGVNVGLLPTKGLTLPFLSYGGSSLVICCFSVGILLRIDYEARVKVLVGAGVLS